MMNSGAAVSRRRGMTHGSDMKSGLAHAVPGSDSDEIQNFDNPSPETEPAVARQEHPGLDRAPGYRTGYRDGFHDATEAGDEHDDKEDDKPEGPPKSRLRRALPYVIGGLVLLALIVAGVLYWLNARHYETTDDAFIDAHVANVSSRISGQRDRHLVRRQPAGRRRTVADGDRSARLSGETGSGGSQPWQRAGATGAGPGAGGVAKGQPGSGERAGPGGGGRTRNRRTRISRAIRGSIHALSRGRISIKPRPRHEAIRRGWRRRRPRSSGGRAQIDAAQAQVNAAEASVREAEANADNAKLQLSYAKIVAPVAGRVAKRNVELGTYVAPGQALIAVVPTQMVHHGELQRDATHGHEAGRSGGYPHRYLPEQNVPRPGR